MKSIVNCCGIQLKCDDSIENMLKRAEIYIEKAADELAGKGESMDLLVLPEQFVQLPETADKYDEEYGISCDNDTFADWISRIAARFMVNVVGGTYPYRRSDGKVLNRALVAERHGFIVGSYDKIHLFDAFSVKESDTFTAGSELGVFDLDIGRIGTFICYDLRFPEIARALRRAEADMFVVPAAFYKPNLAHWDILTKAAAVTNVTPLIAVNQCKESFVGHSRIIDAYGHVCCEAGEDEGYIIESIDRGYTSECRAANPELANRRIDLYRDWV